MVTEAARGVGTRARKRRRDLDAQAGVAFPGLPFDVAVSLVEKHLPDPADLAVLRAVSKGMRDAVDATGRKVEEFGEENATERGYLSTLKCLRRRGRLKGRASPVRCRCEDWRSRGIEGAAPRGESPVGRADVRVRGVGRPPRGAAVGARERLPVGRVDVRVRGGRAAISRC
jgi:hypothetical protein